MKKRQHPSVSLASTDRGRWGTGTGQTETPLFGQKLAPVPDSSHDALLSASLTDCVTSGPPGPTVGAPILAWTPRARAQVGQQASPRQKGGLNSTNNPETGQLVEK